MEEKRPLVAILMGSGSDAELLAPCHKILYDLEIPYEIRVLSAHRTPSETADYVAGCEGRGIRVVIAAAGMAAHLAGACAAQTLLPVIGVPLASGPMQGRDSLLSTVMMPPGIPVATVGVNGAANAGHLAAQILALHDPDLKERLVQARKAMVEKVHRQDREVREKARAPG
jgi:phosphoribosylaminoimidazole carboxylase PurE protein